MFNYTNYFPLAVPHDHGEDYRDWCFSCRGMMIAQLRGEIEGLRKEYDEEVISHDIEEKGLKSERNRLRQKIKQLVDMANIRS